MGHPPGIVGKGQSFFFFGGGGSFYYLFYLYCLKLGTNAGYLLTYFQQLTDLLTDFPGS